MKSTSSKNKHSNHGSRRCRRHLHLVTVTGLLAAFIQWPLSALVAQERVLRFHHMLPEKSPQHQDIFLPWARKIAQASNGRLRVNVTAAMQLGGRAGGADHAG